MTSDKSFKPKSSDKSPALPGPAIPLPEINLEPKYRLTSLCYGLKFSKWNFRHGC